MIKNLATPTQLRPRLARSGGNVTRKLRRTKYWRRETLRKINPLVKPRRTGPGSSSRRHPNGWTPERRARQAAAIRRWQPWRRSTGPKSEAGKARVAANALRHGQRSRAWIETAKRIRRAIQLCAQTVLLVRSHLREQDRSALLQRVAARREWLPADVAERSNR